MSLLFSKRVRILITQFLSINTHKALQYYSTFIINTDDIKEHANKSDRLGNELCNLCQKNSFQAHSKLSSMFQVPEKNELHGLATVISKYSLLIVILYCFMLFYLLKVACQCDSLLYAFYLLSNLNICGYISLLSLHEMYSRI